MLFPPTVPQVDAYSAPGPSPLADTREGRGSFSPSVLRSVWLLYVGVFIPVCLFTHEEGFIHSFIRHVFSLLLDTNGGCGELEDVLPILVGMSKD